jgi:hypothetical protein
MRGKGGFKPSSNLPGVDFAAVGHTRRRTPIRTFFSNSATTAN